MKITKDNLVSSWQQIVNRLSTKLATLYSGYDVPGILVFYNEADTCKDAIDAFIKAVNAELGNDNADDAEKAKRIRIAKAKIAIAKAKLKIQKL